MKNDRKNVENRRHQILSLVTERYEVSVEELAAACQVSSMTVRRDLRHLSDRGALVHMHGKAVANGRAREISIINNPIQRCRAAISAYAAELLVEDGDELFINGSKTALDMLSYVQDKKVTVYTNNGYALDEEYDKDIRILLTGGSPYGKIMVGEYVMQNLLQLSADKTFLGCAAVYGDGEFRYDIPTEIAINEIMISRTRGDLYVLADHTKLRKREDASNVYGSFRYSCPVTLVTDELADTEILDILSDNDIRILQVPIT